MPRAESLGTIARRLHDVFEPIAANVYFAPEVQTGYQALGLSYLPGYFCSRSAPLGKAPGEVVTAVFAVFNPDIVLPSVADGWSKTSPEPLLAARQAGATASLERILGAPEGVARATEIMRRAVDGARPEGRPLFAGLAALEWPGTPIGDLWRACDLIREHRGDSHTAAWVSHGVDAVEITLLTELWWGIPPKTYVMTRGWGADAVDEALERLRTRGLIDADTALTRDGRGLRESIEAGTDAQEAPLVAAMGDGADELAELLAPWADAIVAAGGFPIDPARLASQVRKTAQV